MSLLAYATDPRTHVNQLESRLISLSERLHRLRASCGSTRSSGASTGLSGVSLSSGTSAWRTGCAVSALVRVLHRAARLQAAASAATSDQQPALAAACALDTLADQLAALPAPHCRARVQALARVARHSLGSRLAGVVLRQLEAAGWPHSCLLPPAAPGPSPTPWAPVRAAVAPLHALPGGAARLAAALAAPLQLRFHYGARSAGEGRVSEALLLLPPLARAAWQLARALEASEAAADALLQRVGQRLLRAAAVRLHELLPPPPDASASWLLALGDALHSTHRQLEEAGVRASPAASLYDCMGPALLQAWQDAVRGRALGQLAQALEGPRAWEVAFAGAEWASHPPDPFAAPSAAHQLLLLLLSTAQRLRYLPGPLCPALLAELLREMAERLAAAAGEAQELRRRLLLLNSAALLAAYLHDWHNRLRAAPAADPLRDALHPSDAVLHVLAAASQQHEELGRGLRKSVVTACLLRLSAQLDPYTASSAPEDSENKALLRAQLVSHAAELATTICDAAGAEMRVSLLRAVAVALDELLPARPAVKLLRVALLPVFSAA